MECPACGTHNEPGFRFCSNCGSTLTSNCPQCGAAAAPGFNFCPNCGTSLEAEPAAPAPALSADPGERRFVSALFADLVGFTPFTESRDPEDVRAMLTRYFERARDIIERFGGEVDKFIGDAVTAFWGATVANEDDAERAVRAALELVDAVSELGAAIGVPGLALRAGVLSGETSVGSGGNTTGLVVGDIVNTAARLQSIAAPGSVYVGESTRALAASSIRFEPAGSHDLKGKARPVEVWRAVEVVAERGGRGRTEGLEAPFVGREYELRLLKDQLHAAGHETRARLVSIIGEGGIGKSRLAWELLKYVDGLAGAFYWHQGRSPAYGDGVTFWALGEMVRQRASIAETDDGLRARTKLAATVSDFFPDPDEHRWIAPRLQGLLGLDEMPEGDRADLFGALRTFFQRIAERGTAVLVFEDLHWADEGLLEFIVDLVERSPSHPILVVTLARPALLERRPDWGAARRGFTSVHLGPLAEVDMTALVSGMAPGIEPSVVELVVGAAAGVPLYAVEYVRMLVASGDLVRRGDGYEQVGVIDSLALPDSLQAMVGARLDRLAPDEKALVQDAAVLGQSFTLSGLVAATGGGEDGLRPVLDRLVRSEVLRIDDDPRSPERGQYRFVQSMIREVAYGRLSRAERKKRHLSVARQFEGLDQGEFAVIVASHYLSALEAGQDPDVAAAAREALLAAVRRAADLHSHKQVLSLVGQALDLLGDDADRLPFWELGARAASAIHRHDEAIAMAERAYRWHTDHDDTIGAVRAATVLGYAHTGAEQPGRGIEVMDPLFDPSRASEPEMMRLGAELARAHMMTDSHFRAADVARDTLVAAEAAGDMELVVETLNTRGTSLSWIGRTHEALALLREAIRLAGILGVPMAEARAINNFIVCSGVNGIRATADQTDRFTAIAQRTGSLDYMLRAALHRARHHVADGDFQAAIDDYEGVGLEPEHRWARIFEAEALTVRWMQTGDHRHIQQAGRVAAGERGIEEPQVESLVTSVQSVAAFLSGDPARAYALALEAEPDTRLPFLDVWEVPIMAALRLGDPSLLESGWDRVSVPVGHRFTSLSALAEAVHALFDADPDQAVVLFPAAADAMEAVDGRLPAALVQALFAEAMPDRSEARAAGRDAYDWFTAVGAKGFLHLFHDVWPIAVDEVEAG